MSKISKIRELVVIFCVLMLMKGIVSYAADATVLLYANQKSASSSSIVVTNDNITVWGSVSSGSKYSVEFIIPNAPYGTAYRDSCAPGESFSPIERTFIGNSAHLNLYGNSKDDQKKECIASGGIAD